MTLQEMRINITNLIQQVLMYLRNLVVKPNLFVNYNITQRQMQQKSYDQYQGQQIMYLEKVMDKQFTTSASRNLKSQLQYLNITKKITDIVCQTFRNGLSVKMTNPNEQEIMDEIIDSCNLDAVMQDVDRKVFLMKSAFVKISAEQEEDGSTEIYLDVINPTYTEVSTEDNDPYCFNSIVYPKKITEPSIQMPIGIFAYWDTDTFKLMDQNGVSIPNPDNPDDVNPYSPEIPLIMFRESLPSEGQFWPTIPEDLITAQDSLNVKLTELNQLIKLQSFGIPVLINPSSNMAGEVTVVIDPSKPIVISDTKDKPGDFKFVSPESRIAELQQAIDLDIERIASFYSINKDDLIASGLRPSADSKNASNVGINEVREQRRLIFTPQIVELVEMIIWVYNIHNPLQPLTDEFTIQINENKRYYSTADEKIKMRDWELAHNMTTLTQIMLEEEDDLDYDEAYEKIVNNAEENAIMAGEITQADAEVQAELDTTITGSMPITGSQPLDMQLEDSGSMS